MKHRAASILIVDDEELNRDMLSRRLAREDYFVATATNGRHALQMLATERFDVVLLDLMMPEMDGFETLRQIRKDTTLRDTPVLMLTAMGDRENVIRCLEAGADDYLLKPVNMAELKARLIRCINSRGVEKAIDSSRPASEYPSSTVLVVDDSEFNRDLLGMRLSQINCTATAAPDGQAALAALDSQPFDLVMLDIMMPGMSGFEVLAQIKQHDSWRKIPVIMISGLSDSDSMTRSMELGADDYIIKPFNGIELKARVVACLQEKRLQEEQAAMRRHLEELAEIGKSISKARSSNES